MVTLNKGATPVQDVSKCVTASCLPHAKNSSPRHSFIDLLALHLLPCCGTPKHPDYICVSTSAQGFDIPPCPRICGCMLVCCPIGDSSGAHPPARRRSHNPHTNRSRTLICDALNTASLHDSLRLQSSRIAGLRWCRCKNRGPKCLGILQYSIKRAREDTWFWSSDIQIN